MTPQEKCLFIIKELELSARQVAAAIGKSGSVVSDKIKNIKYNKFDEQDFEKLRDFYVKKMNKIIEKTT